MRCSRIRPDLWLTVALGTVTLVALLSLRPPPPAVSCPAMSPDPPGEAEARSSLSPARPRPPPCVANASMASHPDFAQQPRHIRDFLLHRHCRAFRLLQDAVATKCAQAVFLLMAIKSSPHNYERRELVRRTWGRERQVQGAPLRRVFLVGTANDPHQASKVNRLLDLEARTHGDILQWDFHDSFFNLTLKQVGQPWAGDGAGGGRSGWGFEGCRGVQRRSNSQRGSPPPAGAVHGLASQPLSQRQLCPQRGRRRLRPHGQHGHLPARS